MKNKDIDVRWQRAKEHLTKLEEKYCSLVWYARSDRHDLLSNEVYEGLSSIVEIEALYKDDVSDLLNDEENWQHGFNSGMLAGVRLVLGMMNKELIEIDENELDEVDSVIEIDGIKYVEYDAYEDSIDEFPFLDT
jgi:hypothetical protein